MKKNIFIRYSLKIIKGPRQTSFTFLPEKLLSSTRDQQADNRNNITLLRDLPLKLRVTIIDFSKKKRQLQIIYFSKEKEIKDYRSRILDKKK